LTSETLTKSKTDVSNVINHTKQSVQKSTKQNKISVCDVMKNNTSSVIKRMESQIPSYVQESSDLYTEYLHMYDDLFGTCYISEKEFFDKLGFDQETLKTFDNFSKTLTNFYYSQIDMSTNYLRAYTKMRISAIKSYDRYLHEMMDSYAKNLAQFNSVTKK
jgi:hypothetical protein